MSGGLPFPPALLAVIEDLHARAAGDADRWQARGATPNPSGGGQEPLLRLGEFYLALSPEEGRLIYLLARASGARRIVEFGASFGVSTLYLAAAAEATGGHVTTTEIQPEKCRALRESVARAGLTHRLTLLEGDARETLAGVEGPVDLLFLDGWKGMYLPVFELLLDRLRPGALVLADNCAHPGAADFMARLADDGSGFLIHVDGDLAIACRVG